MPTLPPPLQVVLVANSLPAINDVTAGELRGVVAKAAEACPVIRASRDAAVAAEAAAGGRVPPFPGLQQRTASTDRLSALGEGEEGGAAGFGSPGRQASGGAPPEDLPAARSASGFAFSPAPVRRPTAVAGLQLLLQGDGSGGDGGRPASAPARGGEPRTTPEGCATPPDAAAVQRQRAAAAAAYHASLYERLQEAAGAEGSGRPGGEEGETPSPPAPEVEAAAPPPLAARSASASTSAAGSPGRAGSAPGSRRGSAEHASGRPRRGERKGMFGESYPSPWRDPRLHIIASGQGSPCLDLRRVSADVADATVGTDLGGRRFGMVGPWPAAVGAALAVQEWTQASSLSDLLGEMALS